MDEPNSNARRNVLKLLEILDFAHHLRLSLNGQARSVAGITIEQAIILCRVDELGGRCSVSELASEVRRANHTITGGVDNLEKRGLLIRSRDWPYDRRRVTISVTQEGIDKITTFRNQSAGMLESLLFSTSQEETEARLDRIIANLKALWDS